MKMKNIFKVFVILLILFLESCQRQLPKGEDMDSIVFDMSNNYSVNNRVSFSDYEIISLENNNKCMLGSVDKMCITPKGIYILDKSVHDAIYLFDHRGKFIRRIGMQGHAKNEYVKIDNFAVNTNGDTIYVLDFNKVKIYTSKNKFVNSYELDDEYGWDDLACIDGNAYMGSYHHGYNGIITKYSKDFTRKEQIGNIDPSLIVASASCYNFIQHNEKYICFWDYVKSSIYLIDRENQVPLKKYVIRMNEVSDKNTNKGLIAESNEILNVRLSDDFLFCFISHNGMLNSYVIDINDDCIYQQAETLLSYNLCGYYDGYIYKWYNANAFINMLEENNDNLKDAMGTSVDELSEDDNIYLVRMKVKSN